jgi:aryl-alcohol dehydrogenase-like predicted oxidoreductase
MLAARRQSGYGIIWAKAAMRNRNIFRQEAIRMEYAILGSTERKVSRIGFGGAPAGLANYLDAFSPDDDKARQDIVDAIRFAYEQGINYFDTAPAYGDGASEEIYGEALKNVPPEDISLVTKVSYGDAKFTRNSVEGSLRRLRRNCLDLVQLHGTIYTREVYRDIVKKGGQLDELEKAKSEGLIRHIGFTVECQNNSLYDFIDSGRFETMQVEYNLLFQHPYDPNWKCGSMYAAKGKNMGIVTMRTLTSNIFQQWIRHIRPDDGFDYNEALLQFVLSNPLVNVALVGMRSKQQVLANVKTAEDTGNRINMEQIHNWWHA